jgi:ABC-2 type transport system ATP-binding protein
MIELCELSKRFGDRLVLDRLSLTVQAGELVAFLGPNAAGKTTTIKLIVGLLRPTAGTVRVCGFDVQRQYQQAKRLMSYVPDAPYLYERLTGEEWLQFVGDLYEVEPSVARQRGGAFLERFGLDGARSRLIEEYSLGMKQKLVMCAAFLHQPRVLVIDEPMVGLDPRSALVFKQALKEEAQRGATIFLSTHTLTVAEEVADRVGIIDGGRLVALGSVAELRRRSGAQGPLEEAFLRLTQETEGSDADGR